MPGRSPLSPEERFWSHVEVGQPDDCWLWKLAPLNHGYGTYMLRPRIHIRPSRFTWTLSYGPIPDGLNVCHRCDTPLCCNPAHLFIGTQLDNVRDMTAKGRRVDHVGEAHPRAILTEADVRIIRDRLANGISPSSLASRFGVAPSTIHTIKAGASWRSVK